MKFGPNLGTDTSTPLPIPVCLYNLVHFDSVRISTAPRLSRHVTRSHARSIRMIWTVCIAVWELLRELN